MSDTKGKGMASRAEKQEPQSTDRQVHEGRRVGAVISVRLKPDELELLEALAERDGRTMSETLRLALHSFARNPDRPEIAFAGEEGSFTRGGESREKEEIAALIQGG